MNKKLTNSEVYEAPKAEVFTVVPEGRLLTESQDTEGGDGGGGIL